jgi:hypothetical protein
MVDYYLIRPVAYTSKRAWSGSSYLRYTWHGAYVEDVKL